jgi:eukaryotic-like serine/threonine-protein kinase
MNMAGASIEPLGPDHRLDDVLAAYLEEAEAGRSPDRRRWLASHPEWADELTSFFANLDHLGRLTAPLRAHPSPDLIPFPVAEDSVTDVDRIGYFGDYELIRELGRGGMGVVYEARQVSLGRVLALKLIAEGRLAPPDDLRRFRREAEAAAHLDHPNIVPIHEVGEHDGRPYFSMKLVDGGSLARYSDRSKADPAASSRLIVLVARAVDYAHRRGILHRDLKPSNILLDRRGVPHVADFGLARRTGSDGASTLADAIVGTPAYMAPEQAEGRLDAVTTSADVYGLGAILYELLTGRPPFQGESVLGVLQQVREREPDRPRSLEPSIPRDLETICLKCLEKEPARRYASAEALAEDLERWLEGRPIAARRASVVERGYKWVRRRPTAAALFVACMLGLAATVLAIRGFRSAERWKAEVARGDAARELAEVDGYADRITAAERAWSANEVDSAWKLLDDCPERIRRWEWHYLRRLCRGELRTLEGHNGVACGVAFAPETSFFTCPDHRGGLTIWDASADREVCHLRGHDGTAFGVAFDARGARLAAAGSDGFVRIWDVATSRLVRTLAGHGEWAAAVAFSPDGARIASGGADRAVRISDASTGEGLLTLQGHAGGVLGVAFAPDGSLMASAGADGSIVFWDARSGREQRRLAGHTGATRCVAFSPDGTRLASGGADRMVRIWDARTGREILAFRAAAARVDGLAFSPDGLNLATGGLDRSVKVWEVATGREIASYRGHRAPVFSVSYAANGLLLASASQDAVVKIWDATRSAEARSLRSAGGVRWSGGVAFGPDGGVFGAGSDGSVAVWDASTGSLRRTIAGRSGLASLAMDLTGSILAVLDSGGSVRVLDAWTGHESQSLRSPEEGLASVTFMPDGKRIVTGGGWPIEVVHRPRGKGVPSEVGGRSVKVWDASTGREILVLRGHEGPVYGVATSADGRLIASAGADGSVRVWDQTTGRESRALLGHAGAVLAVAFAPDGRKIASTGIDGTIRAWEVATGRQVFGVAAHSGWATGVSFHPDGSRLASSGADGVVKLWDSADGRELLALGQHGDRVIDVAFSPDGSRLASASDDETIRIWDAKPTDAGRDGISLPLAEDHKDNSQMRASKAKVK